MVIHPWVAARIRAGVEAITTPSRGTNSPMAARTPSAAAAGTPISQKPTPIASPTTAMAIAWATSQWRSIWPAVERNRSASGRSFAARSRSRPPR